MSNLNGRPLTINEIDRILSCGLPSKFKSLPITHQEQIQFYDRKSSELIYDFFHNSKMIRGCNTFRYDRVTWAPFPADHFADFRSHRISSESNIKKWLFKCGIPFKNEAIVLSDSDENAIATTWKIVVKYAETIFSVDDVVVFDESCTWCLYYFNQGHFYFGRTFENR